MGGGIWNKTRRIPAFLRMDKGNETGTMATIHAYLRKDHPDLKEPTDSVSYGLSTSNQVKLISRLYAGDISKTINFQQENVFIN